MSQRAVDSPAGLVIYPGDYLGDDEISAASPEAIGVLFLLLLREWKQMGLPRDHRKLAHWVRLTPARFSRVWAEIGAHFVEQDDRYIFPRNQIERERQAKRRMQAQHAAQSRWGAGASTEQSGPDADASPAAFGSHMPNASHPSPSRSPDRKDPTTTTAVNPGDADLLPWAVGNISRYEHAHRWWQGPRERAVLLSECLYRVREYAGDAGAMAFLARLNEALGEGGMIEGVRYIPTPDQVTAGMQEWFNDTARERVPKLNRWTRYLLLPAVRDHRDRQAPAGARSKGTMDPTGAISREIASATLNAIRALAVHNGVSSYIPADKVKAMGAEVFEAYQTIGGAEYLLNMKPDSLGFAQRDFHAALMAAYRRAAEKAASAIHNTTAGN